MKTARFDVLSPDEVKRIDRASMQVLAEVGLKVDYAPAQDLFRQAGADVLAVRTDVSKA
ncbi:MAG: trimethylamine methyltransferase family protein, partial [Anaerolineae bacterium]